MLNKFWDNIENIESIKKVTFITDTYWWRNSKDPIKYEALCENLIINKVYNVVEYLPNIHPNGRFRLEHSNYIYPKELFITLEESRNIKIDELLRK
jgi:hypothetical protein